MDADMADHQVQPEKLDLRYHDIAEDKRQELLRLFPEIRTKGDKHRVELFKLLRTAIAQCLMQPLPVVEDLDVFKNLNPRFSCDR